MWHLQKKHMAVYNKLFPDSQSIDKHQQTLKEAFGQKSQRPVSIYNRLNCNFINSQINQHYHNAL